MADGYGVSVKNRSGKSSRDEELQEEDVWSVVKDREDSSPKMRKSRDQYASSSSSAWRSSPAAPREIPRANSGSHEACRIVQQSSAPVNIPDWSKIYRKNAKKGLRNGSFFDDEDGSNNADVSYVDGVCHESVDDSVEDDDGDDEMIPPHEYIARKLARSQISSFSMCEGVGRTLKGRDLSKVRNAILTKTGFLE